MAPEGNRFNSFLRILENAISSGKEQTNKKATRACLKVYQQTHENTWNGSHMELKYLDQLRKKTIVVSS